MHDQLLPLFDSQMENRVLPRILEIQADRIGDSRFIDICGRSSTFEEAHRISSQLALGLRKLGVERSDRVAFLLPNCFELVAIWFAASKLGAIEVPNNAALKGELLIHNLNNCSAKVLVADRSALAEIARIQDRVAFIRTLILVGASPQEAREAGIRIDAVVSYEECIAARSDFQPVDVHYSEPGAILYTSGTTGAAKGVLMSHHHYFAWATAMARNLGYTASDSYFSPLPLFHADAQLFGVYMPLLFGTRSTMVESFSASRFWDQVRGSGATATNMLGAMAVILMRGAPSERDRENPLRVCQCLPMVPDQAAFEDRFDIKLVTAYGQTETSFVTLDTPDESRPGSCGRAHPDWEVAVVDEHDQPVAPGVVGEIVSRPRKSWTMFSGYFNQDGKTVQALRNLWYHSGDGGYLDEEGWLYFKHRLSESIRRRGENISPFEVETVAEQHEAIVESAAFGVPSEFTEEDIMLVARCRAGSSLSAEALLAHFQASAPRHMVPRYIEITDAALPRTPTEKVSRSALKQRGPTEHTFDREAK